VIKIGDFARLVQVSVVTLRHYDEIGLFKPALVDGQTGYRYYSVAQLPRLNRILALKDLGFSLEQIDTVLGGLTLEQLRGMLTLKQSEVEHALTDEQARLARIKIRLRQIELEDTVSDIDVVLKNVPPMLIASRSVTIPTNSEVPVYLDAAFTEAQAYARQQGAREAGPCFAVWHQPADILANEVAEAAIPIDRPLPGTDQVRVYELSSAQVAAAVHHGAFENFRQEHTALLTWVEANGYRVAGPYREIYINHDPNHMAESATEIQYPVEKS
jgi:DNA-binding transcriptional MerR regulator